MKYHRLFRQGFVEMTAVFGVILLLLLPLACEAQEIFPVDRANLAKKQFSIAVEELKRITSEQTFLTEDERKKALAQVVAGLTRYQEDCDCPPWETCGLCKERLEIAQQLLWKFRDKFPDILGSADVNPADEALANQYLLDVNAPCRWGMMPDRDKTVRFICGAASLASSLGNAQRLSLFHIMLADIYLDERKYSEARKRLVLFKDQISSEDKISMSYFFMEMGKLEFAEKNFSAAKVAFREAYELGCAGGIKRNIRASALRLARIYMKENNKDALSWMRNALETFSPEEEGSDEKYWLISEYADYCEVFKEFEQALHLRKAFFENVKDAKSIDTVLVGIPVGETLRHMGKTQEALAWMQDMQEKNDLYGNEFQGYVCEMELGLNYLAAQNFGAAKPCLLAAMEFFEKEMKMLELPDCRCGECESCIGREHYEDYLSQINEGLKEIP